MTRRTSRLFPLAAALVAVVAASPLHAQRKSNILSADEIVQAKLTTSTAYEVVELLRPRWFTKRELARIPGTPNEPMQNTSVRIWLNEHNAGDADYLRTIPANRILQMRWYSQNEAASRFGPTDGQAAIEVTLQR